MLIHTLKKALMQGSVSLTRHRIDLISSLVCALIQVRSVNVLAAGIYLDSATAVEEPSWGQFKSRFYLLH